MQLLGNQLGVQKATIQGQPGIRQTKLGSGLTEGSGVGSCVGADRGIILYPLRSEEVGVRTPSPSSGDCDGEAPWGLS